MAIITLCSASGSPGVTTTALGLALSWTRPVILVEADATDPMAASGAISVLNRLGAEVFAPDLPGYRRPAVPPVELRVHREEAVAARRVETGRHRYAVEIGGQQELPQARDLLAAQAARVAAAVHAFVVLQHRLLQLLSCL